MCHADAYLQTYIERDVRQVAQIEDLLTFRRFVNLCAARAGQILNMSDMAAPLGVSVPTIKRWLSILELTGQIILVPPYFSNLGKRLIKSPKLYFGDIGLLTYLLNLDSVTRALKSPFAGILFEHLVLGELLKIQTHRGRRPEIYFFRDQSGLEVDFLFPSQGRTWLIEVKLTSTPLPRMAGSLRSILPKFRQPAAVGACVVTSAGPDTVLAPGVVTQSLGKFCQTLQSV